MEKQIWRQNIYSMLSTIHPKLPMRNKSNTMDFYCNHLQFIDIGKQDYDNYLILQRDNVQIHFFEFMELNPLENYGQVYIRTENAEALYQSFLNTNTIIHPTGGLQLKPWGQIEFSILDPDNNLLTFGQSV